MKRVSFETAKALKEAGYPQENNRICYSEIGDLITISGNTNLDFSTDFLAAPTYLDVWLWLWREKGIAIDVKEFDGEWDSVFVHAYSYVSTPKTDPEEAISTAVDCLVENNLIK